MKYSKCKIVSVPGCQIKTNADLVNKDFERAIAWWGKGLLQSAERFDCKICKHLKHHAKRDFVYRKE